MSNKDHLPIGMEIAAFTGYDRHLISIARGLEKVIIGHNE
jgi:hypothetical protein